MRPKSARTSPRPNGHDLHQLLAPAILEHIPDIVVFKDKDSRFIAMSNSLVRRVGADGTDALMGKSDADLFSEESAERTREDERQIVTTGKPMASRIGKQIWKDGRVTRQLTSKFPLRNKRGAIIGTFGFSRDVTKEYELESALRQSNGLIWHADVIEKTRGQLEWRMTLTSSSLFRRIFGKDPPPGFDHLWTEDIVPKWKLINARSTAAILDGKVGYNQQFQVYVRQKAFYLDEHVSITRVGEHSWSLVGIVVDITARRKAELALIAERDRIALILEMMSEAVIATDYADCVAFMNQAAAKLTQWSTKEAIGRLVAEILPLTDADNGPPIALFPNDAEAMRRGSTTFRAAFLSRLGNRHHVEVTIVAAADKNINWRVGAVLVLREILKP